LAARTKKRSDVRQVAVSQKITEAGHPETRVKAGRVIAKATVVAVEMVPGHRDQRRSNVEVEQGNRGLAAHKMNDILDSPCR
jgi:hypothetical protein